MIVLVSQVVCINPQGCLFGLFMVTGRLNPNPFVIFWIYVGLRPLLIFMDVVIFYVNMIWSDLVSIPVRVCLFSLGREQKHPRGCVGFSVDSQP